ncbi:MAG: OmpA family protein [bacterium]
MKQTIRLLSVLVAVGLLVTMVGCPKKQVVAPIPEPIPEPEPEPVIEKPVELNFATIYFDFDNSAIRAGEVTKLEAGARLIKDAAEKGTTPPVIVQGHSCPIGTAAYNMALGMRRAESVKAFLVKLGVPAARLTTISFGEEKPVTTNPDQYEQNRRVELKPEQAK